MSSTETLHYIVHVRDIVDRLTSSIQKDVVVLDNDLPILGTDHTAKTATTGETLTFSLEARDNIGIEEVWVEYQYGEGASENVSLSVLEGDVWEATIVIADTLGPLQYSKNAVDAVGNVNSDSIGLVDVIDNDGPEIVNNGTPRISTTGDPFTFSVTVSDNIGIRSVDVWYSFGDAEPTSHAMEVVESHESGNVLYSLTIGMPSDSLLPLSYNLEVWDLYGNVQTGIGWEVEVVDNDRPVIEYEGTITEALKGFPVTLTIDAGDNIGVEGAFIVLRYVGLATTNLSMEPSASHTVELSIPRDVSSDLHYLFSACDAADNWYSTVEYTILLKNAAPAVKDLPQWTITEEAEGELDLTSYISDVNDDLSSLTVSCGDGTVTVNGLVLMALFNEAVPDWTIDLTVSDGEDDTDVQITIHIVNVN
ncbi:MAG: hypothetical protein KAS77_08790, partial [Thermoplasmata archaeon]|nr:hypothetical protein [Thermoplasmata archaeon]